MAVATNAGADASHLNTTSRFRTAGCGADCVVERPLRIAAQLEFQNDLERACHGLEIRARSIVCSVEGAATLQHSSVAGSQSLSRT